MEFLSFDFSMCYAVRNILYWDEHFWLCYPLHESAMYKLTLNSCPSVAGACLRDIPFQPFSMSFSHQVFFATTSLLPAYWFSNLTHAFSIPHFLNFTFSNLPVVLMHLYMYFGVSLSVNLHMAGLSLYYVSGLLSLSAVKYFCQHWVVIYSQMRERNPHKRALGGQPIK